jgi:cephalosporin-C deacetylase-like acetyl esterase
MLRRDFLAAFAPQINYRDYSRVLPDYLARLAAEAYRRRGLQLATIRAPEDAVRRQRWVRETFWRLVGGEPERTPLNARATGSLERPHYRVEKLLYESRPGLHVSANLYLPKQGRPPYPGVLFQLGHAVNGKAASFYQYCCQGLAQLGYVVLAFDPMGQGERTYYPGPNTNVTRLPSADDEHTLAGKLLLLTGDTSTRFQVWDAVRSLDYLASHPMVDSKRLASTGNSGGGTLTMFLAAVDDRLACAVAACPNTENHACANFNPPGSTDDAEQNFIGGGPAGFDRWDTVYPMAPKPLMIIVSAKDFLGTYSPRYIESGREEFSRLERIYKLLGRPANLAWRETPLPHGMSYDVRMATYNWFRRHLQGFAEPLKEEPPVEAEKEQALYASATGNVVRDLHGLTPRKLALATAASIQTPARPARLRELLGVEEVVGKAEVLGEAQSRHARIEALDIESAPGVHLPAWLFHPQRPKPGLPLLLIVEPGGRNTGWNEDSRYQQLAAQGQPVCALDVRGIGDLRPEYPRQSPGHARSHQEEEAFAWASLMLGRPLLGQRVTDLLGAVEVLARRYRVVLSARGSLAVPALFAAALTPKIDSVCVSGGPRTYRELLEQDDFREPLANLLPDVLRYTDIPPARSSACE